MLDTWSPGTADLLDYGEVLCDLGSPAELASSNPTMCWMNKSPASAREISGLVRYVNPTDEGNPDTSKGARTFAVTEGKNSVGGEDVRLRVEAALPLVNPADPSTRISEVRPFILTLGSEGVKVPLEPPDRGFTIPPLTP